MNQVAKIPGLQLSRRISSDLLKTRTRETTLRDDEQGISGMAGERPYWDMPPPVITPDMQ